MGASRFPILLQVSVTATKIKPKPTNWRKMNPPAPNTPASPMLLEIRRSISPADLRWETDQGLLTAENHCYVDMKAVKLPEALKVLEEEKELLQWLEDVGSDAQMMDQVIEDYREIGSAALAFDLGTSAAVYALSAVGCVTFSSCNGGFDGSSGHIVDYPSVLFYAKPRHVPRLLLAAELSGVGMIVNHIGQLELYADDIRLFAAFSEALLRGPVPKDEENIK